MQTVGKRGKDHNRAFFYDHAIFMLFQKIPVCLPIRYSMKLVNVKNTIHYVGSDIRHTFFLSFFKEWLK